ncbi:hypothetical protein DFH27DRAFT_103637 [Peziza echinospora]|nr:hypothetical protein DFH27DRAFT_103637 [Peziza echinospora]
MSRDTFSLLGAIKCSNCNADVDISELGDHVCSPVKEIDEPAPVVTLKLQYGNERQGKHSLPPIDSSAANRPYLGRNEPTPRSSSEDGVSPATPPDGQPLTQPFSPPEESAGSSNYTDGFSPALSTGTASDANQQVGGSGRHLYAPAPNSAMYAPVSPTATAGRSLMEKLTTMSPGPFALQSSQAPPLSSSYGERPSSSRGKDREFRDREEAGLRAGGGGRSPEPPAAAPAPRRDSDATEKGRPPTSGSDRSSGSRSSGPDSPKSKKNIGDLRLKKSNTTPVEKPMPSPSYMAYRPPQPPVRLPRSPTFPEQRPVTPGYGSRPPPQQIKAFRPAVGLPSSPAHGRKPSIAGNAAPRRPSADNQQQQLPRRPSADDQQQQPQEDRSRPQQRNNLDRLVPDARDRSRSTPRTRDGEQQQQQRPESPAVRNDDLQNSIEDLAKSPIRDEAPPLPAAGGPVTKPTRGPPAALTITKPSQMMEPGPPSARILSPTRKTASTKSNCRGCSQAIQGKGLTSSDGRLTGRYHKHCFVCQTCREPFSSSTFYVWENLPYCSRHYHKLNNSLCTRCDNGIEGACLETEKNDRFHPECFTCVVCYPLYFSFYKYQEILLTFHILCVGLPTCPWR